MADGSWAPALRPGHLNVNVPQYMVGSQFKHTLSGIMEKTMKHPPCTTSSLPRMLTSTASIVPPAVSQQPSVDITQTAVIAILPSANLLGSFDKPWMIERMAPASEVYLPKHEFPLPACAKFFARQRKPLLVAADDQFRRMTKYAWVRG
jgi:hypothetical protein